jgi:hypothetical protein
LGGNLLPFPAYLLLSASLGRAANSCSSFFVNWSESDSVFTCLFVAVA